MYTKSIGSFSSTLTVMYSEYRGLLQEEYIPSVKGTHSTLYTQRYSEYRELLQEE